MPNSSATEEDVAPYDSITTILVQPMANLTVMLYVYGIYTVLFVISLRVLIRRRDRPNWALYMFFTTVLFTLTTAYNIVVTFFYAQQATREFTFAKNRDWDSFSAYLEHDHAKTTLTGFEEFLPIFIVTLANLMLLHRCYVIWSSSKRIAFPMIFLMVSLAICEIVGCALRVVGISNKADPAKARLYLQGNTIDTAFWPAEMGVNIILTLLIAGRLWWMSREARKHTGSAIKTKYETIVAIILESGILYPIFLTADVIYKLSADPDAAGLLPFSLSVVLYQVAGIAPTLIIIRAVGGKTDGHTSRNQVLSSLHFADGAGPGSGHTNTRSHVQTVDLETRALAEGAENSGKEKAA